MGDRLNAFRGLLADAKPVWLCMVGLVLSAALSAVPPGATLDQRVLYGGVWLQVFGLGFVALGFSKRQRTFGLPTVRSRVTRWFVRLRDIINARPQHVVLHAGTGNATISGSATLGVGASISNQSLERQVELLRQEIEILRVQVDQRFIDSDRRVAALQTRVDEDRTARVRDHASLASKIHDFAVGDLDDEVVGFVWLLFSVVATAIPSDVIWLVRRLFG